MKQFTHAWLAFAAIRRLEDVKLSTADRECANSLTRWFKNHKDGVIRGAWYPDSMIKDMASSHVLKITPAEKDQSKNMFKALPATYLIQECTKKSPLREKSFVIDKETNLPDRCESIAHSVIDHLKTQEGEEKGSPVSPSDNQIALILFMLSHYVADGHVPFHCDARMFSKGKNLHAHVEGRWDEAVRHYYRIDEDNERFFYDSNGYPLMFSGTDEEYESSYLRAVDDSLKNRTFTKEFGDKNNNVWDFMSAVCQHSYLLSYSMIPQGYDHTNVTLKNWEALGSAPFGEVSRAILSDAIDSIARVWFRVWQRYVKWEAEQRNTTKLQGGLAC
ncbi:MAG: hypothetical protein NTX17_08645 [Candidatus Eisenbacteria bacterium]|nr:hypothetical protein [Candidatus Eisenbacteria bacterium]